jgi:hypothetical protein
MKKKSLKDEFLEKFIKLFNAAQNCEAIMYERKYSGKKFKITIEKIV